MRLQFSSSMRELKTYCQSRMPRIASKLKSLLWEVGQIFKRSLAVGERLTPSQSHSRAPLKEKNPVKFYLVKYFIFLNLFISPEKLDSDFEVFLGNPTIMDMHHMHIYLKTFYSKFRLSS